MTTPSQIRSILELTSQVIRLEKRLASGGPVTELQEEISATLACVRHFLDTDPDAAAYRKAMTNSKAPEAVAYREKIVREAVKKTTSPSIISDMTGINLQTVKTILRRKKENLHGVQIRGMIHSPNNRKP